MRVLHIKDVVAAIHMIGAALGKVCCHGGEERSFVEYALHGKNDSIPVGRVCDHACPHGGVFGPPADPAPILLGRWRLPGLGWGGAGGGALWRARGAP